MGKYKDLWNHSKDGNRKEQRSFLRVCIVATALALCFLMLKRDNIISWIHAGMTIRSQERQMEQIDSRIEELDARIKALTTDKDSLERFAREYFHFTESGDDVFIIEE